jgi:hypothetical protein
MAGTSWKPRGPTAALKNGPECDSGTIRIAARESGGREWPRDGAPPRYRRKASNIRVQVAIAGIAGIRLG